MELRSRLLWLIILRILIASALLVIPGSNTFTGPFTQSGFVIKLLLVLLLFSVACFLVWAVTQKYLLLFYVQIVFDLAMASFLVFFSGGMESKFTYFLYLIVIVYSTILTGKQGGITSATLSIIFYLVIVIVDYLSQKQTFPISLQWRELGFSLPPLTFIIVAYLAVYLSEHVKKTKLELEEKRTTLADLQATSDHIINSIRSGLITIDLNGNIMTFNNGAVEITGYKEELGGAHISFLIGEWLWNKTLSTDFSREKKPLRYEAWRKTRQGKDIFLGIGASPLYTKNDTQIGYIISFQDLTETKRLEEEIKLKEKMAAIGNLAASIAHEIRNPLASIKGSVQLMRSELPLIEEKARLMDIVLRESDRLNKIVEDFLVYAKPQRSNVRKLNVSTLLSEIVQLLKNSPEIKVSHKIDTILPVNGCELECDPDQIKQVFWNLAQNGLKAMPEGGKLLITTDVSDGVVKITFADTGIGMAEDQVRQIFQPFYSQFSRGVGLGMSIVYQIVQAHNGKIYVQSRKGIGTTITLEFPGEFSLRY